MGTRTSNALIIFMALFFGLAAQADEEIFGYDEIVEELSQSTAKVKTRVTQPHPFDAGDIHVSFGLINSYLVLGNDHSSRGEGFFRGFQATLGIDLFSPNWIAEISARRFGEQDIEDRQVALQEYDMKLVFSPRMTRWMRLRLGVGLSARYLDINSPASEALAVTADTAEPTSTEPVSQRFRTPAGIGVFGLEGRIDPHISLGADAALRKALVNETVEESSFEVGLRLGMRF